MNAANHASAIYYEVHGDGFPLMLSYPLMASPMPDDPSQSILHGYLDRLTDRYRVLVMDYPNVGRSTPFPQDELTVEQLCQDLLGVADRAGFERFVYWGFSWGGLIGLQLASRSARVAALVCGGWPPLGGPYAEMLIAIRKLAARPPESYYVPLDQIVTFYESVQDWPEEEAVSRIRCPRMTFVGTRDEVEVGGIKLPLGATVHARRGELERQGWRVDEVAERDHSIYTDPTTVVPLVRRFLDPAVGA